MENVMAKESLLGMTENATKEDSRMTRGMDMVPISMLIKIHIKEDFLMV